VRSRLPLVLTLSLLVPGGGASAQDDPLSTVPGADPLELARAVARLGDDALLGRLSEESEAAARLSAIRATPWMRAPELALTPLAEIARGRDPDLAPAAAMAALRIAQRLESDDLVAREASSETITEALEALRAIGNDEGCRRDIRRAGLIAADRLSSLLSQS
jgi:hypothetical protein